MGEYIITVKVGEDIELFKFDSEQARDDFISDIKKKNPKVEYATPVVNDMTIKEEAKAEEEEAEEEEWRTPADKQIAIQKIAEIGTNILTVYERIRHSLSKKSPILVYKVRGAVVVTQTPMPEGAITQEELDKWLSTLIETDKIRKNLMNVIIKETFDIRKLSSRSKK